MPSLTDSPEKLLAGLSATYPPPPQPVINSAAAQIDAKNFFITIPPFSSEELGVDDDFNSSLLTPN